MENKLTTKKEFWHGGIFAFLKLFFFTVVYLSILIGGMLILDSYSPKYGSYFIWLFLTCSSFGYIYHQNKDKFTKENLTAVYKKVLLFSRGLLRLIFYISLVIVGISILVIIGGLIAGLSATTIIIILLVLILLK